MSFDQDPHEQANISAADFAMMCDEMKELKQKVSQLESSIAECRDAAGFGTDHDPMNVTGWAALGLPEEVPAFIKDQFDRLRNDRQWQPIKTAPKDGSHFLAWTDQDSFPYVAAWFKKNNRTVFENGYCDPHSFVPVDPIFWMPLPEAPKHQD